jgi:hypothetical protein
MADYSRRHSGVFARPVDTGWLMGDPDRAPGAGRFYIEAGVPELRRLYLTRIACHIYYTFDDEEVIVRALWGARRERGPQLKS